MNRKTHPTRKTRQTFYPECGFCGRITYSTSAAFCNAACRKSEANYQDRLREARRVE